MDNRPYASERHEQFCREIEQNTSFEIEHYKGRWFYEGPAVMVEGTDLQRVIRATTMEVQTDDLGKTGVVIYPR